MAFCKYCGNETTNAKFCGSCSFTHRICGNVHMVFAHGFQDLFVRSLGMGESCIKISLPHLFAIVIILIPLPGAQRQRQARCSRQTAAAGRAYVSVLSVRHSAHAVQHVQAQPHGRQIQ